MVLFCTVSGAISTHMDPVITEKVRELEETKQNGETHCRNMSSQENKYWSIKIYKSFKISIFKPLISLKIALFLWMSAATSTVPFIFVFLKQRGFTLSDLLLLNSINPVLIALLTFWIGVLVDKLGQPKGILIFSIIFAGSNFLCLVFLPPLTSACEAENPKSSSYEANLTWSGLDCPCVKNMSLTKKAFCSLTCFENQHLEMLENYHTDSALLALNNNFRNISVPLLLNKSTEDDEFCICSIPQILGFNMTHMLRSENCTVSCLPSTTEGCDKGSRTRNIYLASYIGIMFLSFGAHILAFRFFDVTSIMCIKEHGAEYGYIRVWTIYGAIAGFALSGVLLHFTTSKDQTDYSKCIYLYSALCLLTALVAFKVNVRPLDPGKGMLKKSLNLIKCPDVVAFFLSSLAIGTAWSIDMMYRNLYLNELGCEAYIYSLIGILNCLYGAPFMYKSKWLLNRIGDCNLLVLAFIGYGVRFYAYSTLTNSWPSLLIEFASLFHYHLYWLAVINFLARISPDGLLSTVNSTNGVFSFIMGRMCGGFFGAMLMKTYGGRFTFQILGVLYTLLGIVYGIFLYCRRSYLK